MRIESIIISLGQEEIKTEVISSYLQTQKGFRTNSITTAGTFVMNQPLVCCRHFHTSMIIPFLSLLVHIRSFFSLLFFLLSFYFPTSNTLSSLSLPSSPSIAFFLFISPFFPPFFHSLKNSSYSDSCYVVQPSSRCLPGECSHEMRC